MDRVCCSQKMLCISWAPNTCLYLSFYLGFLGDSAVKNLPTNADDAGLIPRLERSPGRGNATHSSVLAGEIPWTEEHGGLKSMGSQKSGSPLSTHTDFLLFGTSLFSPPFRTTYPDSKDSLLPLMSPVLILPTKYDLLFVHWFIQQIFRVPAECQNVF